MCLLCILVESETKFIFNPISNVPQRQIPETCASVEWAADKKHKQGHVGISKETVCQQKRRVILLKKKPDNVSLTLTTIHQTLAPCQQCKRPKYFWNHLFNVNVKLKVLENVSEKPKTYISENQCIITMATSLVQIALPSLTANAWPPSPRS